MDRNGLTVTDEVDKSMQQEERRGHTAVIVAVNGEPSYLIPFSTYNSPVFSKMN